MDPFDPTRDALDPEEAFLGRGFAFPVRWQSVQGRVRTGMVSGRVDIQESIRLILSTVLGERVMQPKFGSMVDRFVFATIDTQTASRLAHAVRKALLLWERRIREIEVVVATDTDEGNRLDVEIRYSIDTHRLRQSLVLPFYVDQGEGE